MSSRDEILARVRAALADAPQPPPIPQPRRKARRPELDLLEERLRDDGAEVRRAGGGEVAETIRLLCAEHGCVRIGVPPGLPAGWRPAGVELVEDGGLAPAELDRLDGVVTGATLAIAETGTLLLSATPVDGRRALTLVPDLHVCVMRSGQVVADVPAAFRVLASIVAGERRPLTFVSGPSATSDIELSRVEGVHGPRTLAVVIVTEEV